MQEQTITHHHQSTVCVVGGGPAGMILAYLLARQGITVTLLEAQKDFDRHFRGDTIHSSIMENLDQMGLAEKLLQLPHQKADRLGFGDENDPTKRVIIADFSRLKSKYPFVTLMAQSAFLDFMAQEAGQYATFNLLMPAIAQELITEVGPNGEVVRGVRYRSGQTWGEVRADLVVAADGRTSKVRELAKLELMPLAAPMEVVWFRLTRRPNETRVSSGLITGGPTPFIILQRDDHWQIGLPMPHGGYRQLRDQGLAAFQQRLIDAIPELADRVPVELAEWRDVALLNVRSARLQQWWRPGLLLIGDAAHVMTPVGGIGINYAIQDAIVTANTLVEPLRQGTVITEHLAAIQQAREWPTRFIQAFQRNAQRIVIKPTLASGEAFTVPRFVHWLPHIPILRTLPARMIGQGVRRVDVKITGESVTSSFASVDDLHHAV